MRARRTKSGLTVRALARLHVVLLGMSMPRADCEGHMGFAIHRTDDAGEEARWMSGIKTFEATDPGFPPGATHSTREHPVQGITWSDYSAKPGRRYKYRVLALKGTPQDLQPFREVAVRVTTESEAAGDNDVYFKSLCIERLTDPSLKYPPISHHKFIVLLKGGEPIAVLTCSTNFSVGGVYGQANVVHVVEQPPVATAYVQCRTLMAGKTGHDELRDALPALNKILVAAPPRGIAAIFSPQQTLAALDWYAARAKSAKEAIFMTFAFGMSSRCAGRSRTASRSATCFRRTSSTAGCAECCRG